ncbi:MAG: methyltransferase domain-containing protein [Anaerolineae bacterium]
MNHENDLKAISLGHPSYVWRFGQDRRLDLIQRYTGLEGKCILDVGCGLGTYMKKLRAFSNDVYGVDIDPEKVAQAQEQLEHVYLAPAEELPFPEEYFDVVLLHEVLEHVTDDRQAVQEAYRVAKPGGRLVIFVPNRLYPFETHGIYWRGEYHFGNVPLVNYLPLCLRNRLCPHVRTYTVRGLRQLFVGLPHRVIVHTQIYPGYDNVAYRHPALAKVLRKVTYTLESTPLRIFGLSHLLVVEKA